jgi:pyridoxal phosphate enzyme (YggS family)
MPASSFETEDSPAGRLAAIRDRIDAASRQAPRHSAPLLVAVSKTFAAPDIVPLIAAGQRVFGENRVQEAVGKWPALKVKHPGIELHLIGPLQTNKLKQALDLFDVFHTLDRPRLADALARERDAGVAMPQLFVQVNTGAEAQKAGVLPDDASGFIVRCRDGLGLRLDGLMCIPPVDEDPAPHFKMLAALAKSEGIAHLSMGMSADFEVAIRCGASHVRVGSALFGSRPAATKQV